MFSKLTLVALISVVVAAPQHHTAAQFPAGVDPSKCPNFPICDNAILHSQQPSLVNPAPSWNPQPQQQWNQPQQSQWNQPQSSQWNQPKQQWNSQPQPQWNQPQPSWNTAPYQAPSNHLSGDQQASDDLSGTRTGGDKYPAGVNPQSCPNYPYCDGAASHDNAVAAAAPPLQGYNERQYPAGVSPHTCPNFPYCN